MANQIVTVNVSQVVAPAPNTLQRTGALISQGGTTLTQQTMALLTQASDLTAIIAQPLALSTLVWSLGTVTATTAAAHGYTTGAAFPVTIAGATPSAYNGNFVATATGASTFTYALVSDPGSETVPGTYIPQAAQELTDMVTTFFAQGTATSVYVLELGHTTAAQGVAVLNTFINASPQFFYSYLVPREWDGVAEFLAFMANFESTTSKTYFFITASSGTYTDYTALMKCAVVLIQAPAAPAREFTMAAVFHASLSYAPSSANLVTPFAFTFVFGVTPYPAIGNSALLATWKAAGINVIGQGSEGGISNTMVLWGTTMDGHDFTYWYSVDWVQINIDLDLSNEVINGSNNPLAPLYYDQNGINRLQARAQQTMNRGIAFGLVLPPATVTAVAFLQYVQQNPSDYPIGRYAGLAVTYTPQRGFISIVFNVVVSQFPIG